MAHLTKGLQDPDLLLKFERTSDLWERSRLVWEDKRLHKSFMALSDEQRAELAKQAEVKLIFSLLDSFI